MTADTKISPMMMQWQACKESAKEAILLFRLGDFYEAFHEDAVICSQELELTLTKRQTVPMSGIPSHTLEGYIDKLIAKGYKVAIAEQVSDPSQTKGLLKREISRIITPGTLFHSSLISDKSPHYMAAITEVGSRIGIAFLDITCSDCRVIELETLDEAFSELYRFAPKEVISSEKMQNKYPSFFAELKNSLLCMVDLIENWRFDHELAYGFLIRQLKCHSLDGFGLKGMLAAINAAGALLAHVKETLRAPIDSLSAILPYSKAAFMSIDKATIRNLNLVPTGDIKGKQGTLQQVLDYTKTPMGGRLLKRWILQPLIEEAPIHERQNAIEELLKVSQTAEELLARLYSVRDLERIIVRITTGLGSPRDFSALKHSLAPLKGIKASLAGIQSSFLKEHRNRIDDCQEIYLHLDRALVDDPPLRITDGAVFKPGYHEPLDNLRSMNLDSQGWITSYQTQIREETGIKTLKVGFTRISGFYIEVSKGQTAKIPAHFQRRQTLTNAERYMTPELKNYEEKILSAEETIQKIEADLFKALKEKVSDYAEKILTTAQGIAHVDCILSLAQAAKQNRYTRPHVGSDNNLKIIEGRHPVIEASNLHEKFIANDTELDSDTRLMLITGPNMAGKSTYIRQVALITIMAQIGSFVPAKAAHIDLVDKVFSRIGASDDLSRGQSTFMVEMVETAYILHHATSRSLVILDEIGRGTSTYDGISLAWSIAEFLLKTPEKQAKTLFATHYWELTKLEGKIPGAKNFNVAVHEGPDKIIFLRKIIRGGTDKSYGIHVAKLAGLPKALLERAEEILEHLEENSNQKNVFEIPRSKKSPQAKVQSHEVQLSFLG